MSKLPPSSATLVWTLSTTHEDIRCLTWRHATGWTVCVYFGGEQLATEEVPTRDALRLWSDAVRNHLISLGFGPGGRLGGQQPPPVEESRIVMPPWMTRRR